MLLGDDAWVVQLLPPTTTEQKSGVRGYVCPSRPQSPSSPKMCILTSW